MLCSSSLSSADDDSNPWRNMSPPPPPYPTSPPPPPYCDDAAWRWWWPRWSNDMTDAGVGDGRTGMAPPPYSPAPKLMTGPAAAAVA
uniref:Uncharacterized protein n=1 Tax=Oryza nivara TaxID=4536 RepID=A0A0E0G228_ORYNI